MSRQDANAAFALSSFLYGANASYIDDLYAAYEKDPNSVEAEWRDFFGSLKDSPAEVEKNAEGPSWARANWPLTPRDDLTSALDGNWVQVEKAIGGKLQAKAAAGAGLAPADVHQATRDSIRALMLIRAYRMRGHFHARLDPLGLEPPKDNEELDPHRPHPWPRQTQEEVRAFFGNVGTHQTMLDLPYTHRLAWDKNVLINRYSCHEKVHDSLNRILTRVHEHYGEERIIELRLDLFGGCFNKRKKKGGSTWSMHAWGVAVDYDPENNQFRWGWDRASFARPEYDAWWKIWEEEGWTGLGRSRNYDWMHIQAPHL